MTSALYRRLAKLEHDLAPPVRWFVCTVPYGDAAAQAREAARLERDEGYRPGVDELIFVLRFTLDMYQRDGAEL
jgi:hypothetical protein